MATTTEDAEPEAMDIDTDEPQVADNNEALRPIAILIDELSQEDMQIRIGALKQVTRIAQALGSERTRDELIPYLTDMLDDDDEVLRIVCEVLLQLMDFIGGQEYCHCLIPPYETLCVVEELSIRTLALEKLAQIISLIPQNLVNQHVASLFERLFSSGWHTARTAAAGLAPHMYPRFQGTDNSQILRNKFLQLAGDSMPQVRRSVAENIGDFAKQMQPELAEEHVFPVLTTLANDDLDSVRVRALEAMIKICDLITQPQNARKVRYSIRALCADPSWRVRFLAAREFNGICTKLKDESDDTMLDIFLKLLKDGEAEVRAAASSQLPHLSGTFITEEIMNQKFVSIFTDLSKDENKHTRAQFAEVIVSVGKRFSSNFVMEHILPLVLELLKDPEPEPRLRCLSHLDLDVVNALDLLEAIMPCITQLAKDKSWRIRKSVMEMLPSLSARLGPQIVDERIKSLMFDLMTDQVQAVREEAARTMLKICRQLNNPQWTEQTLTEIFTQCKTSNYLRRQTAMEAIQHLTEALPAENCLEILLSFTSDPVPNVRFKVCNIISSLLESNKIKPRLIPSIVSSLDPLRNDTDVDVRYFSNKTLTLCSNFN